MTTLVVSDLHLGSRAQVDVLRDPEALDALAAAAAEVDRVVVLGDGLELRHGPPEEALSVARPVLARLADALGPDGEIVLVAGNHDHAIVAPWLERRRVEGAAPLGLEERPGPDASPIARALADAARGVRVDVAYPGIWLRPDVFAIHGHYLDLHVTVPTVERLAAGAMTKVLSAIPERATPEHYEAALGPIYAWTHVVARHTRPGAGAFRQTGSAKVWRDLTKKGRKPLRQYALAAAFPLAVAGLNRAGIGPVSLDLSPAELRRAGLRAMHEALRRLEVEADHVVFGHTHRTGPRDDDDPAAWGRLLNTGCWVQERVFTTGAGRQSPYWAGAAVRVPETGPPERLSLLGGR